jgi:osmotically-inducible protein OsmY
MSDQQTGTDGDLVTRIHDTLAEAGIHIVVEPRGQTVYLSGEVDSDANRQAALDVAHAVADPRGLKIEDTIDVLPQAPQEAFGELAGGERDGFGYLDPDRDDNLALDPGYDADADLTDDVGTTDAEESVAEAVPFFPPTDPVVRPSDDEEQLAVLGGFEATAMDDDAVAGASFDNRPDDDISADVLRELREDSLTTELIIQAITRNGVVHLRGEVPTLEDAENAEAVAARVAGVKEVQEELVVASLREARER